MVEAPPLRSEMVESSTLQVAFGGHSTAGIKTKNQDAFAADSGEGQAWFLKGAVAAIADGVSTGERSEEASQLAVTHFISDYYSTPETWTVRESAARVLNAMNTWLFRNGRDEVSDRLMTTFSCAIIKSTTAHLFHVGDCRIYLYRNNTLEQLTQDHNAAGSRGRNILTRALGGESRLQVDYVSTELLEGDRLLLTTDGVHGFLSHRDIQRLLVSDSASLEHIAEQITSHALSNGADDNLSCLLVDVEQLPLEEFDEAYRRLTRYVIPPIMEPGNNIDGYRTLRVLHSSTRSHLYLVENEADGIKLVLKSPSPNFSEDTQYLEGFLREQWIGARIEHPNIMKVYPRPQDTRFLYNLFEFVEGTDLRQWMQDHPQPSMEQVRRIVDQIATALRAFQRKSMIHRDLKPENVLIDDHLRVKLIDFGTIQVNGLQEIDRPFGEQVPVGTADYIAPEYLLGEQGMYRSDIFSLGVMTYEMLAGCLPYKPPSTNTRFNRSYHDWHYKSLTEYRPELPEWVDLCLQKATAPSPANRYQSLSEFMQDLRIPSKDLVEARKSAPLLERNPLRFWQLLCGCLLVIVILQALF